MFKISSEAETEDALRKMPKQVEQFYQRVVKKTQSDNEKQAKRQEILDRGSITTLFDFFELKNI